MFSNLNIASKGIETLTSMEWNGKLNSGTHEQILLDSDDDDEDSAQAVDPLKIIAQNRDTKKNVAIAKPEVSLITKEDLEEIKSFQKDTVDLDPHAIYICEKEKEHHGEIKSKFMPFKTTKSDSHSIEKEKLRKFGRHWEITAATPPPLRNAEAKELTLQESIELQTHQLKHLKVNLFTNLF